jgi:hypothetical protein
VLRSQYGWQSYFFDILRICGDDDDVLRDIVFDIFKVLHLFAIYRSDQYSSNKGNLEQFSKEIRPGHSIISDTFTHLDLAVPDLSARKVGLRLTSELVAHVHSEVFKSAANSNANSTFLSFTSILQLCEFVHRFLLVPPSDSVSDAETTPWWLDSWEVSKELISMMEFVILRTSAKAEKDWVSLLLLVLRIIFDLITAALVISPTSTIGEMEMKTNSNNVSEEMLNIANTFIARLSDLCVHDNFPHYNHSIVLQVISKIDW